MLHTFKRSKNARSVIAQDDIHRVAIIVSQQGERIKLVQNRADWSGNRVTESVLLTPEQLRLIVEFVACEDISSPPAN